MVYSFHLFYSIIFYYIYYFLSYLLYRYCRVLNICVCDLIMFQMQLYELHFFFFYSEHYIFTGRKRLCSQMLLWHKLIQRS